MIEIYKKLPKTNCGKCGVTTCMAFAQKVKKLEAKFSECPFIDESTASDEQTAASPEAFSNYDKVSHDLEKRALNIDFREAAEAIGGKYESIDGKDTIKLVMINALYELRKDGLFKDNVYCTDAWTKIIIYDYVQRKGISPLTGEWITLGHFPHTASHVKAFQNNAEKKIAESFKNDLPGLKRNCTRLGGIETEPRAKSDFFCSVALLPRVPLYVSFWAADEEFGAECKLLFDSNAEEHIDIEYLASLLEMFVEKLTGDG